MDFGAVSIDSWIASCGFAGWGEGNSMVDVHGATSSTPPDVPAAAPVAQQAGGRRRQVQARLLKDWERAAAVAVAIVTLCAALLTYVAVRQDDAAAAARGQATLETLQLQRQKVMAVRVDGESNAASRYRRSIAEAESLESQATAAQSAGNPTRAAQLRAEALVLRSVADAAREATFDPARMRGTTSAATYDTKRRLETIKGYEAFEALEDEQPTHTAAVANARHLQSIRTMLAVVMLLMLVLLLTVGRVVRPRWRTAVLTTAVTLFVVAMAGAGVNAVIGG
jgi:hypothetical protein